MAKRASEMVTGGRVEVVVLLLVVLSLLLLLLLLLVVVVVVSKVVLVWILPPRSVELSVFLLKQAGSNNASMISRWYNRRANAWIGSNGGTSDSEVALFAALVAVAVAVAVVVGRGDFVNSMSSTLLPSSKLTQCCSKGKGAGSRRINAHNSSTIVGSVAHPSRSNSMLKWCGLEERRMAGLLALTDWAWEEAWEEVGVALEEESSVFTCTGRRSVTMSESVEEEQLNRIYATRCNGGW